MTDDRTNPKDRIGQRKPPLHLVPASAIIQTARAMANGAAKYGAYNWREKAVRATVYLSAADRHLKAWLDGEELAEDSGVPHLAHATACLAILLDAQATGNLVDDRPPAGAAARLIAELTESDEPLPDYALDITPPLDVGAIFRSRIERAALLAEEAEIERRCRYGDDIDPLLGPASD